MLKTVFLFGRLTWKNKSMAMADKPPLEHYLSQFYVAESKETVDQTNDRVKVPWFYGVRKVFIWEVT